MPLIATDVQRYSNVVKRELWSSDAFCRDVVTVNEAAAKTYAVGTLLGKVTAGGKFKICVQNAADGSQTAAGICLEDKAIAAATDTKVLVLVRGPAIVSKTGLILDASHTTQAHRDAIYAALLALGGIHASDAI